MAQRDTKSTAMKERPSSKKFQTSLSQPASSNVTDQEKPNPRRHLTLPISLNNNYPQSPAERYIASRTQMLLSPNEQQDISPSTPSSIATTNISSIQSPMSHADLMHNWRQKKSNEICKKQKHRYVYGTPPSSSITSPTSFSLAFPLQVFFPPSTQLNLSLSSQRNNLQSSMTSTRTVKKDNLTERSKTNESHDKMKMLSTV